MSFRQSALVIGVALGVATLGIGCSKLDKSAAAKAKETCDYKHENPKFCYSPPAGFTPKPEEKLDSMRMVRLHFTGPENQDITLEWGTDKESYERSQNSLKENSKASGAPVTDEPGGYSFDWAQKGGWGGTFHLIQVFRSSATTAVSCNSNSKDAQAAAILAACKTLKVD